MKKIKSEIVASKMVIIFSPFAMLVSLSLAGLAMKRIMVCYRSSRRVLRWCPIHTLFLWCVCMCIYIFPIRDVLRKYYLPHYKCLLLEFIERLIDGASEFAYMFFCYIFMYFGVEHIKLGWPIRGILYMDEDFAILDAFGQQFIWYLDICLIWLLGRLVLFRSLLIIFKAVFMNCFNGFFFHDRYGISSLKR